MAILLAAGTGKIFTRLKIGAQAPEELQKKLNFVATHAACGFPPYHYLLLASIDSFSYPLLSSIVLAQSEGCQNSKARSGGWVGTCQSGSTICTRWKRQCLDILIGLYLPEAAVKVSELSFVFTLSRSTGENRSSSVDCNIWTLKEICQVIIDPQLPRFQPRTSLWVGAILKKTAWWEAYDKHARKLSRFQGGCH